MFLGFISSPDFIPLAFKRVSNLSHSPPRCFSTRHRPLVTSRYLSTESYALAPFPVPSERKFAGTLGNREILDSTEDRLDVQRSRETGRNGRQRVGVGNRTRTLDRLDLDRELFFFSAFHLSSAFYTMFTLRSPRFPPLHFQFSHLRPSLSLRSPTVAQSILFVSLVAFESLFVTYWVKLRLIPTLPYFALLSGIVVLSGKKALGEMRKVRLESERKELGKTE
jgi:hypothetical protein